MKKYAACLSIPFLGAVVLAVSVIKTMCSYQFNIRAKFFDCENCDFIGKRETELGKNIDEKHDGWRVTQNFVIILPG